MSVKDIFTRCLRKQRHETKGKTEAAIRSLERRGMQGGTVYLCTIGGKDHWHVTTHAGGKS